MAAGDVNSIELQSAAKQLELLVEGQLATASEQFLSFLSTAMAEGQIM